MSPSAKKILDRVSLWPEEDQEELAEIAREIESRRAGVYVLSDEERKAIAESRSRGFATDDEIASFWKRHGIA